MKLYLNWATRILLCVICGNAMPTVASSYRQIDVPGATYTYIYGINSAGQMVGEYITPTTSSGFLYTDGVFSDINYPGASDNTVTGINDHGDMVGTYYDNAFKSFLYQDGQFTTIVYPGASSTQANAINNAGDIVGGYVDQASMWHGFLLHQGVFTSLDVPGGDFTIAFGINDSGIISGYYTWYCDDCDILKGFLLYQGRFHISSPNIVLTGINNQDEVVGNCNMVWGGPVTACLFAPHKIRNWNYPGVYSTSPNAINNSGVVVGTLVDYSNYSHGFIAQP